MNKLLSTLWLFGTMVSLFPLAASDRTDGNFFGYLLQDGFTGSPVDLCDLYAWKQGKNLVLALTLLPMIPPLGDLTTNQLYTYAFNPYLVYRLHIDNNGDNREDFTIDFQFTDITAPSIHQFVRVSGIPHSTAFETEVGTILSPKPPIYQSSLEGIKFFAGPRDDPYFFDYKGLFNGFTFVYGDTLARKNILAIILELPLEKVINGDKKLGFWASVRE